MKKNKYLILSLILLMPIFGCNELLEENPLDSYGTTNFYSGADEALAAVNAAYYNLIPNYYQRELIVMSDSYTDDATNGLGMGNEDYLQFEFMRVNPSNGKMLNVWERSWQGISKANQALQYIPDIEMQEELKNRLLAEASFLRALYYFNLANFWGGVPIVLTNDFDDAFVGRSTVEQVHDQMILDLEFAENNLPNSFSGTDIGRATKGAVKALLGRIYLGKSDFQQAASKLGEIVNSEATYGYGLHDNYDDNWRGANTRTLESVFTIDMTELLENGNRVGQATSPKYSVISPAKTGLKAPWESDIPSFELMSLFNDDNDERKATTFTTVWPNAASNGEDIVTSRPLFYKYWDVGDLSMKTNDTDFHVIRYADVLLMYAEALNETGNTTEALNHLNRVRERAFNDSDHNYSGLSQDECRTAIWDERRLELSLEGVRFFDLKRTGRFVQRMQEHSIIENELDGINEDKLQIGQNVKEFMALWPIPQRERDLNPDLEQNPGY